MDHITFLIILAVGSLLGAYTMSLQDATQYWGRKLTGAPAEDEMIAQKVAEGMSESEARGFVMGKLVFDRGYQDAITPKYQNLRNVLFFACLLYALIGGWIMFRWYFGIAALLGTFFVTSSLKLLFPAKDSRFFFQKIRKQLYLRCERHKAEGDLERVDACQHFLAKLDDCA